MTFRYRLEKIKPSWKAILKKRKFLYINQIFLLKHRIFLHRFRNYLRGYETEFDEENLQRCAFQQQDALSQRTNRGGKINLAYLPKPVITY